MSETLATVERKTSDTVMGASASTLALDVPFPIDLKEKSKMDLLTMVVSHILNTPDIYDINNLARPGVCGDYAVVLKEQIDKKFLPFMADASGQVLVAYQNPEKLIKDKTKRAKICTDLADTALRIASIVLACLGSIQVASETRVQKGGLNPQRGGSSDDILNWLIMNKYITTDAARGPRGQVIPLNDTNDGRYGSEFRYQMVLTSSDSTLTTANLSQVGAQGSLRIQFLDPILIPGTTEQVLPIRVLDTTGIPWMVGIMFKNIYKPLSNVGHSSPMLVWNNLFRKSRGEAAELIESDFNQLQTSSALFDRYRQTRKPDAILQLLDPFFQSPDVFTHIPNYRPNPYGVPPNPYGVPPNPYGVPPNPYGAPVNPYGAGAPVNPYAVQPNPYAAPAYGQPYAGAYRPQKPVNPFSVQYAIPDQQMTRNILSILGSFKELFTKTSCPASVRANTLSLRVNPDRTIRSGICADPYWKEGNLGRIYPYATFQFLCMKDWRSTGYTDDLKTFVEGLGSVYGSEFKAAVPLDSAKFSVVPKVCSADQGREINVKFEEVQKGLQAINAEYKAHTKAIWTILGELVEVIEDPETKTELVRLVPNATKTNTKKYIDDLAVKARTQIGGHYVRLEGIYYEVVKSLV
jgi:hypothetical protein